MTTENPYIHGGTLHLGWAESSLEPALSHGVAFETALKAFRDPFAVEQIDDREDYGEERINMLGMCDGVILFVTYTERGEEIRLISARRAERHERDHYFRENSA